MNHKRNLFLIIAAGVIVYINSLGNGFVWDDIFTVINNDFIRGFRLLGQIFSQPQYYFSGHGYLYYRPLQTLSHVLDYFLWGLNPVGFHLDNLLLHICAAILLYFFINILCQDRELAFLSIVLFAVHPIQASVVDYITGRSDILVAIFAISSLMLFLKAKNYKLYLFSLLCFSLALLSKEIALVFPLILIFTQELYMKMHDKKGGRPALVARLWYAAFISIAFLYILLRIKIAGVGASILAPAQTSFFGLLFTLVKIILEYLKLIYFPQGLHMLRNIPIPSLTSSAFFLYAPLIVLGAWLMQRFYRISKVVFYSSGFFLLWVLPIGLIALKNPEYYSQGKAIMEEHWLYLPSIGIFIFTVYLLRKASTYLGKIFYKAALLLIILCLGVITLKQNTYWKNNHTLFTHTLEYVKNSTTLYRNLGWIYLGRQDMNKSLQMYRQALEVKQEDNSRVTLYKDIAYAYLLSGQVEQATDSCLRALNLDRSSAETHAYLGLIYAKSDSGKAVEEWRKAQDINPFEPVSFNNLVGLSRSDEAIRNYLLNKYAGLLDRYKGFERYKLYRALGIIYLYNDMGPSALSNLKRAQGLNPYDVKIINALAVYYAKSRDYSNAVKFFKQALRLNPFDKEAYVNFAFLCEQLGQKETASRLREKSDSINIFN